MILKLLDYRGKSVEHEIGDVKDIRRITIMILTGDKIAEVVYKNSDVKYFDTRSDRIVDYYDGSYEIYNIKSKENPLYDEEWQNRKGTYDYLRN